ncbi:MAG TPA: hypothetical protein RMH85_20970 [Polyangiaceae bacterium LLY-WYZ-15_(1-7)]|nr:hypothetical protein [Myxococcales bacterium]MAT26854.1 hypothetical protein [Sandaracinus sp.]HJK89248.1 hypothetical protein [Polyangiaceae bacterium LLY-WYZ-15_(1-7)]HJL02723.1 hypothetical protein [Polyangiaceae bacterium LLY-WYZ-15_(1-7)]HJL10960.1 hypothetical protein [Polyangiaceae bacterium LLY-WYZ-15_(1-7)]
MALTRLEADRDRTILYYPKPAKVPLVVHALRVVVGITLLLVLTSLVVKVGSLIDIGEQVEEQRQFLYQQTSWDMDRSVDGRWRYCQANPPACQEPWGEGGPLHLFRPEGWETLAFESVDFETAAQQGVEDPSLDIADACGDLPCGPYLLSGDFSGPNQAVFMAKEMLKVLGATLLLAAVAGFGAFFFMIFQYVLILVRLGRGYPGVHKRILKIGLLQMGIELALSWYVSEINESVYSFTLYRGCAPILATALLMVALSQLPAVKRHCNAFTWKREPDTPSPQGALPPEGQVPPGATPPTAA